MVIGEDASVEVSGDEDALAVPASGGVDEAVSEETAVEELDVAVAPELPAPDALLPPLPAGAITPERSASS